MLFTTVHGCDDVSSFINSLAAQFFAISPFEPWLTPDKVERVRYKALGLNVRMYCLYRADADSSF